MMVNLQEPTPVSLNDFSTTLHDFLAQPQNPVSATPTNDHHHQNNNTISSHEYGGTVGASDPVMGMGPVGPKSLTKSLMPLTPPPRHLGSPSRSPEGKENRLEESDNIENLNNSDKSHQDRPKSTENVDIVTLAAQEIRRPVPVQDPKVSQTK